MYESTFYPSATSTTTYHGACHCGAVQFTIALPDLSTIVVNSCNCSICEINGYLNVYPFRKDFQLHSGEDVLRVYRFATKHMQHKFCGDCGTSVLIDFSEKPPGTVPDVSPYMAINVRTLKDIDLSKLKIQECNGRAY